MNYNYVVTDCGFPSGQVDETTKSLMVSLLQKSGYISVGLGEWVNKETKETISFKQINQEIVINYEQKQIQKVIDDKVNNSTDHENYFPNIIRMKISSENEETNYINLSLTQLKKIQEILK